MIANLERTQSNTQQNEDKHSTPTNNGKHTKQQINNNRTTSFELTAAQTTSGGGGLNAFYWYQIFALDSVAVQTKNCLACMEAFYLI